jgi:hypothetical protein
MKRKIIVTMAAIVYCLNLSAQDSLKITFLNPSPIVIGGKEYKQGDSFLSSDVSSDKLLPNQVIKAFDATTGKKWIFTRALLEKSGSENFWVHITGSKGLSTRDPFNRTFGLFVRLKLNGELPVDSSRYYYVGYEYQGEQINKRLPADSTNIVLDRSIFTIDGKPQTPFDVKLKLCYYDSEAKKSSTLSNKLVLNVSEANACRDFISAYLHSGLDRELIRELIVEYLDIACHEIEFLDSDIELFVNNLKQ